MATPKENDSNIQDLEDDLQCLICYELFKDPRLLPCSHTFCYECIQGMASSHNGKCQCPLRCPITLSQEQISQLPINRIVKNMVECIKQRGSMQQKMPKMPNVPTIPAILNEESKEILNLSVLQGLEKRIDFYSHAYGYLFRLSKPMKLLSVEVKVDVDGPVTVLIVTNCRNKIITKSTIRCTRELKWIKIPIVTELNNQYLILVHSSAENAMFACKYTNNFNYRPISQICSVSAVYTVNKLDELNFGTFFDIQCHVRSLEMHIDVER